MSAGTNQSELLLSICETFTDNDQLRFRTSVTPRRCPRGGAGFFRDIVHVKQMSAKRPQEQDADLNVLFPPPCNKVTSVNKQTRCLCVHL